MDVLGMDARILGQLLLMQSVMTNLPDEEAILGFVCRGLADMPGVASAVHASSSRKYESRPSISPDDGEPAIRLFPLRAGNAEHGVLALTVTGEALLEPYVAYLNNFCFMLAVILEERRQRRLIETHKAWLEERVEERAAELKDQSGRREAAEAALRESEERFRQLMELAPEAIVVIDAASDRPIMANRKAEKLFGCSRQELMEKGYHCFYREEQPDGRAMAETIREHRELALAGGEVVFERAIRNARGEDFLCEVRLVCLSAQGEGLLRASWVDITARKKMEATLAAQNIFLNTLLEVMPTPFYFKNTQGEYLGCNRAFEELLGYPRGEIVGRTVFEVATPEQAAIYGEMDDQLFKNPGVQVYETDVAGKQGVRRVILSKATYLGQDGNVAGLMGVITDISERKLAEDALKLSEERFRAMAEASISGFWVIGTDGVIKESNEAYARMSGYSREDLAGMPISAVEAVETQEMVREHFGAILRNGGDRFETRHRAKDGRILDIEASVVFVPEHNEAMAFLNDITARKQAEERLRRSLEEKTVLLQEVHHRVKNNLQVLMSLIDLQAETLTGKDSAQAFRLMQNRVRSIALAHERLYRSPDLGAVQMREYLNDLVRQVAASHPNGPHVLALVDVEELTLGVDRAIPIGLLVTELVTNAYKHAFKGAAKGELQVGVACRDLSCLLTVADDGPGLPELFDAAGGTSLGMQLVRALAGQLRGTLHVVPGPGARFALEFPLKPGEGTISRATEGGAPQAT